VGLRNSAYRPSERQCGGPRQAPGQKRAAGRRMPRRQTGQEHRAVSFDHLVGAGPEDRLCRKPVTGVRCCAPAAIGHRAVAATSFANSRRRMRLSPVLPRACLNRADRAKLSKSCYLTAIMLPHCCVRATSTGRIGLRSDRPGRGRAASLIFPVRSRSLPVRPPPIPCPSDRNRAFCAGWAERPKNFPAIREAA
jgi:hypothetical protein